MSILSNHHLKLVRRENLIHFVYCKGAEPEDSFNFEGIDYTCVAPWTNPNLYIGDFNHLIAPGYEFAGIDLPYFPCVADPESTLFEKSNFISKCENVMYGNGEFIVLKGHPTKYDTTCDFFIGCSVYANQDLTEHIISVPLLDDIHLKYIETN